ncbi:MAG: FmdE family protein [Desulfobacterales bacterium]|jgi:formylmethanofuran dehydrogenase subunit E
MKDPENIDFKMPDDLKKCVEFHGHLCPGLVYGYLVAEAAMNLLELKRSKDEEVVAISENDSCAVDALQVLLGTSTGKGNLILKDYGKNAYTVFNRKSKTAYRFSRKNMYRYDDQSQDEFIRLDAAISSGTATAAEKRRHKMLKSQDLLRKPFGDVFSTEKTDCAIPPYAPIARSEACAKCGEMTMSTKMVQDESGKYMCIPCGS